ncbi:cytochrome P450 81E8-like protein [Carex littledalei]|uniref:Cytochrome P450 81E8-like protein n=1 Tax=Carex littledalei TaxID=544730 RepID=A0A833QJ02_9POAL|nr:cytochrome P450 81E8-like protein [Carex littledalei]
MAIFVYQSILLSLAVLLFIKLLLSRTKDNKNKKLPPSPPALPLIGHLHLFKKPLHQTLASISEKYGPATFLKFGSRKVLVISSRSLAEECFTTNDMAFANRAHLPSVKQVTFDYNHIGAANYGPHWRNVRQIAATELLSPQRLHASSDVRVGEVRDMVRQLFRSWNASAGSMGLSYFEKVDLKAKLFELSLNVMMTMIAGKRFYGDNIEDLEETKRFREAVEEFFSLGGASNEEDFLPILKFLGMAKAAKKLNHLAELNKEMTQKLIDEHRKPGAHKKGTMIANMLELQKENPEKYNDRTIQIIVVSLLQAGTDTSSNTVEWAITLLLNNPDVLKKASAEIDAHVGTKRLVQESDMPNLTYLHCILNEVLRLYPGGPLLVPHESRENVSIGGYEIPQGTMLLVNAYHIHRDPSLWDEPTKFMPERFESDNAEAKKMIPFGMGRRRCPGEGLAIREVGLILGTFIQCFDWQRIGDELIDMGEGSGLTLPKAVPLEAMYHPRQVMMDVLSTL